MDSNTAISHFSAPLPLSQPYNAADVEEPEPEDYETASDPEADASDFSEATEKTLLPEEEAMEGSPAMENQKLLLEDEGEVDSSSEKRISSDSFDSGLVGEKMLKEDGSETKLNLTLQEDLLGSGDSCDAEVAKNVGNGVSDIRAEKDENLSGEMVNTVSIEESQGLEPNAANEEGSNDTAIEPKDNQICESEAVNYTVLLNQGTHEEMEPNERETEYIAAVSGEVGTDSSQEFGAVLEEEKFSKPDEVSTAVDDDLEHENAIAVEPNAVEMESKLNYDETETVQNSVDIANASECSVAGHESEIASKDENLCGKQEDDCSINKTVYEQNGKYNLQNPEVPESNAIDSANDEDGEKGEGLDGGPAILNFESVNGNVDMSDQVIYNEQNERNFSLNQEVVDEKMHIDSERISKDDDSEHLPPYDGVLKSVIEVETIPVTTKETEFVDENSSVNNLHQLNSTEIGERSTLIHETSDEEILAGLEHGPGSIENKAVENDGVLKSAETATLQTTAKENIPENGTESYPQNSEVGQKVAPVSDESLHGDAQGEKNSENLEDAEVFKILDDPARVEILDSPEAKHVIREMEKISSSSQFRFHGSQSTAVVPNVSDSDDVMDSDEDGEGGELFDSAALAALLKAATGSSDGAVTVTSQDATRIFSVDRPAGLGTSPSLRPSVSRSVRPSLFAPSEVASVSEPSISMTDDEKKLHEKVEQIRVKFLRLVQRLGHSPEDTVAAQVLYRLSLAEGIRQGRQVNRAFSIENAKKQAQQLEEGKDDLEFSCNILVIGKTGVGKSATINSIFGEEKSQTSPFQPATTSVKEISGVVDGVRIRVVDTPGLNSSVMDQASNRKILSSIKNFTKKCPPDIVLYVDRMDTQTRDFNDLPLLKSITSILGSSIWFNAIVALTHAASAPPDGPNGPPLEYEVFVTQRSHVVQHSIRQAAGDMRLMNPVALVENHPSCRRNREGERVLPNGLSWRPQLLLLSYSSKILSEANSLLKLQDPSPGKLFGFRLRSPPLPFLLSSLLQSRVHPKLSGDNGGDNADSDVDMDDLSDAEQDEEEYEYDQLPPFKPLKKAQIAMLSKEQKRAYFDEYDYRVKLLLRKQLKEELRRLKENKKRGKDSADDVPTGDMPEDYDQDGSPAAVQVPLPDMVLPPSFDCDNPVHRYRFLEPTSQLLTRPVLGTHGWDHDCGYDGVSIEESLAIAGRFPTSMAIQITKDKKEFNIHLDSSIAAKHGEYGSTLAGLDIQSVGKQLAYILRGETKIKNFKKNKTAAGVSVTFLGETVASGFKIEDKISIGKRLALVASTGAVRAQKDVAFGANLEARLRDTNYPFGQALSTLGLSLMKWRSDLALGANLQSQFSVGRNSKMAVRVGLNNKLSGQITVRTSTSEQLQIALAGIIPLAISIYRCVWSNESYLDH